MGSLPRFDARRSGQEDLQKGWGPGLNLDSSNLTPRSQARCRCREIARPEPFFEWCVLGKARSGAAQTADGQGGNVARRTAFHWGPRAKRGRMRSDGPPNAGVRARRALGGNGPMNWRAASRGASLNLAMHASPLLECLSPVPQRLGPGRPEAPIAWSWRGRPELGARHGLDLTGYPEVGKSC